MVTSQGSLPISASSRGLTRPSTSETRRRAAAFEEETGIFPDETAKAPSFVQLLELIQRRHPAGEFGHRVPNLGERPASFVIGNLACRIQTFPASPMVEAEGLTARVRVQNDGAVVSSIRPLLPGQWRLDIR